MSRRERGAAVGDVVAGPWVLPEGWRWDFARNVLPLEYGKALRADNRLDGTVQVFGSAGKVGVHDCSLCDEPALIVGRKGSAGSVYYADQPSFAIDTAFFCRRSRASIDLRYGFYFLQFAKLGSLDQSTAVPSLSRDSYDRVLVPVPDPERQSKISSRIDVLFNEIDDGEAALARARADLEVYRRALLKAAVTGELTADWRAANPACETGAELLARILADRRARWHADPKNRGKGYTDPKSPDASQFPKLPEGWAWTTLDVLKSLEPNSLTDGPFGSNLKSEHYVTSGPRVLRLQNIGRNGDFLDAKAHITREHYSSLGRHHVEGGDIVIAILGDPLPRAVCVPESVGPALVKADCFKLRLCDDYERSLMWAWLNCSAVHGYFSPAVKGVGRPRIGMDDIRALPVPVPSRQEQAIIVEMLADVLSNRLEAITSLSDFVAEGSVLRQSILAAAFRGDLT